MGLSRRGFLAGIGGTAVVATGVVLWRREPEIESDLSESVQGTLSNFLTDHDGAAALGRDRLADHDPGGTELIAALAPDDADAGEWFDSVTDEEFAGHIRTRVRSDFANDDTADVSGWILASTEADLCALWALVL